MLTAPVVILRPEPGAAATLATARALGLEAHGFALFDIAPVEWTPPDPARIDALLLGSANAARHGGAGLDAYAGLPVYAVGAATADAARAAGLRVVATGAGGLQALLAQIAPPHRRLLRLAGAEYVALTPPAGITLIERTVYAGHPRAMPDALARLLMVRALPEVLVLMHSAAALRHFARECDRLRITRARIRLVTIGVRVAAAAGEGWAGVHIAAAPSDAALLALARQLCHDDTCH